MRAGDRKPCAVLVYIRELCGCVCRGSCGGMCVCAECTLGRGFIDAGVGGCVR